MRRMEGGAAARKVKDLTFSDMVAEFERLFDGHKITAAIWKKYGLEAFNLLPEPFVIGMLYQEVRRVRGAAMRRAVLRIPAERDLKVVGKADGVKYGGHRGGMATRYWGMAINVEGKDKPIRELTIPDLKWLVAQRMKVAGDAQAWAARFNAWIDQAKKHKVTVLRELEEKGVELMGAGEI